MQISYLDIDGLNLRDGAKYNLTPTGLFGGDRDIIMNELYTPGQSWNRSKTKQRQVVLTGYILGDILDNINALKAVLFKDGLKKITIGVVGMPTVYLYADLQSWASDEVSPEFISCQLVAPDPFLYGTDGDSVSLGATSSATLTFPMTFPIEFGATTGATGVITNGGNAAAYPVVTIIGTCDTLTVANTTTGESMSCAVSLVEGDTLIIDSRPVTRGIYLNGAKRMDLKDGDWLTCQPGDNTFTFARNSLEEIQHCSITVEGRWY